MFNANKPTPPGGGRYWLPLALAGALVVVAGIMLPQMLGGVAPLPAPPAADVKADADATKGSLDYAPPSWPEAPDPAAQLGRLAGGTAVVLVLCVGTLLLCRRWLRRLPGQPGGNSRMALVETLPLGNRCVVHLVRVGKQQVMVGVDSAGLKSLVALPEVFDEALADAQETPPLPTGPALAALVGAPQPAAW